jgi:hypothetical protein
MKNLPYRSPSDPIKARALHCHELSERAFARGQQARSSRLAEHSMRLFEQADQLEGN